MTNNQALIELMQRHQLTATDVARLIAVSPWTVKNWVRPSMSKGFRKMPDIALMALAMSIEKELLSAPETPTSSDDHQVLEFLPAEKPRR